MQNRRVYIIIFSLCLLLNLFYDLSAFSQSSKILENYVQQGLANNHALQQKELNLEISLQALKEANGLFYPSLGLEAQYSIAHGGRSIDIPLGDMLNPVYSSLNQLLQQPGAFPQIANEKVQFLPNDYHDTKVRMIIPLINAEIFYNRKIKKELICASQAEVNVYKRELIKEIKIAYFRYLQSLKVVEAYSSALELVNEARRVNQKLVDNQLAGSEKLYRIEAEKDQVIAKLTKANNDVKTSASYFNFLLNQPLQNLVIPDSLLMVENVKNQIPKPYNNLNSREEIVQLNSIIKSADYNFKLKKSHFIPTISNITDIGYQGYSYSFDNEQQYAMNTITLSWPIFNGFSNRSKIAQAHIENEILRNRLSETEQQIELQSHIAQANFESSLKSEEANKSSFSSSKEYYDIVNKQYALGQKSLLDLLDAQNQLTSAQINYAISFFETLIRLAELERAIAGFDLSFSNK